MEKFIFNHPLETIPLKVCILNVDYTNSSSPLKGLDPLSDPRIYMSKNLPWTWHMVYIDKANAYSQIRKLSQQKFDLYMNFCDGAIDEDRAGVEVIQALEEFNLPYTGCDSRFFTLTKKHMKEIAMHSGINTPKYHFVYSDSEINTAIKHIGKYPMIVKHHNGYTSLGLTSKCKVWNDEQLREQAKILIQEYNGALIEEFIEGDEYTVLVIGNPENPLEPRILNPIQFIFGNGETFKHFDLKYVTHQNMDAKSVENQVIKEKLIEMAKQSWLSMNCTGFGRLDIRVNNKGELYFLEINSMPKVFSTDNFISSADYILKHEKNYKANDMILDLAQLAFATHEKKQLPYNLSFSDLYDSLGLFATRDIKIGENIISEEEKPKYLISKKHSEKFHGLLKYQFNKYAYPISDDLYNIWSDKPEEWKPLNHSCDPNLWYAGDGTQVIIARYNIKKGDELTMDYATFLIDMPLEFQCKCNKKDCRGKFTGQDYKLKHLQEKYKTHFSLYVNSKINKLINNTNQEGKSHVNMTNEKNVL